MPLVPAKCTSCGAQLTVDSSKDAAICEYCNTPYIVEKAINNYHLTGNNNISINSAVINVQGAPSAENLLKRAAEFEQANNLDLAVEYYNRVLDLDFSNAIARNAIDRIENSVLAEIPVTGGFVRGLLTLTRHELIYTTKRKREVYPTNTITSVSRFVARLTITVSTRDLPLDYAVGSPQNAKTMEIALKNLLVQQH